MDGPESTRPGSRADELLAQAPWMRRLALALAGPGGADDLLQDAWLASLPGTAGIERPRAWLRRVLSNAARLQRRGEARRRAREQAAARAEALPSAADLAAEAELQERAVRCLLELDEPYRETLLLRFFRDLEPSEIARAQGVPASTVRNRLHRGLEQVRQRMDMCHGGSRKAWLGALLALPRDPAPLVSTAAAAAAGGLLVSTKLVAGIATAIVGAALVIWIGSGPRSASPAQPQPDSALQVALADPLKEAERLGDADREPRTASEPVESPDVDVAPLPERWDGRVVDRAGAPVSGARVWFLDQNAVDRTWIARGPPEIAGDDGRFRLSAADGARSALTLMAEHPGYLPAWAETDPGLLVDVVLAPAAVLEGVVLDRDSGLPLGRTRLWFGDASWRDGAYHWVTADDAGRFRFESAEAEGPIYLSAAAPGRIFQQVLIEPEAGPVRRVEIRLAAAGKVEGLAVDLNTGAPVMRARIRVDWNTLVVGETGIQGRFALEGFSGEQVAIELSHPDYSATTRRLVPNPEGIELFPMVTGCALEGLVLGPDGNPVADSLVTVIGIAPESLPKGYRTACEVPAGTFFHSVGGLGNAPATRSDVHGRFQFAQLSPFSDYRELKATLFRDGPTAKAGPFAFAKPGERLSVTIAFPTATGTIQGVFRIDGHPARARLRWTGASSHGSGRANEDGRFRLEGVEAGTVRLHASARPMGRAGADRKGRELDVARLAALAAAVDTDVEVDLPTGAVVERDIEVSLPRGRIGGRVRKASGAPAARILMIIELASGEKVYSPMEEDGSFGLGLDAETGEPVRIAVQDHRLLFEQAPARVGDLELELVIPDTGALRVRVVDSGGRPRSFRVDYRRRSDGEWQRLIEPWMRELEPGVVELELPAILLDLRFTSPEPDLGETLIEDMRVTTDPGTPITIGLPGKT